MAMESLDKVRLRPVSCPLRGAENFVEALKIVFRNKASRLFQFDKRIKDRMGPVCLHIMLTTKLYNVKDTSVWIAMCTFGCIEKLNHDRPTWENSTH